MQIMKDIPEVTKVVVVTPAKTVLEQIFDAPLGSVFAETLNLSNGRVPYRTITRTGRSGWWVTGQSRYWGRQDIKRWVKENPTAIVALYVGP